MRIRHIEAKPLGASLTHISISVSGDRTEIFKEVSKVIDGLKAQPNGDMKRPYDLILKPYYPNKSNKQLAAIWAKIGLIAEALETSKDEIYEECIKRYGQGIVARLTEDGVKDLKKTYAFVEVKESRDDNTYFVKAWRGLSTYDTYEAKVLLDGVLSECREMGLNAEIEE